MIYTIGNTESYERAFTEHGRVEKMGRHEGYPGGCVWKTRTEAEAHCPEGYSVYGVLADWEEDTEPNPDQPWHDLLVDAPLVQLETETA